MGDKSPNIYRWEISLSEPFSNLVSPLAREGDDGEDAGVCYGFSHNNPSVAGELPKGPGILLPHEVQLAWQRCQNKFYTRLTIDRDKPMKLEFGPVNYRPP